MNLKIAICDDESELIEYLTALVASWGTKNGCTCEINSFLSAEEFLFAYEDDSSYDILLLDVEMKNISGIELAKRLRKDNNCAEIIFVTSHFEFVGEGYEVDALHYLIKPVAEKKLNRSSRKPRKNELFSPVRFLSIRKAGRSGCTKRIFYTLNRFCTIFPCTQQLKNIKSKRASRLLKQN